MSNEGSQNLWLRSRESLITSPSPFPTRSRSLRFYCDVLGLKQVEQHQLDGAKIEMALGVVGAHAPVDPPRCPPGTPSILIDLMEFRSPCKLSPVSRRQGRFAPPISAPCRRRPRRSVCTGVLQGKAEESRVRLGASDLRTHRRVGDRRLHARSRRQRGGVDGSARGLISAAAERSGVQSLPTRCPR